MAKPVPRGRPRVTLTDLTARWQSSDPAGRKIVEINWARSCDHFLRAMIEHAPVVYITPTIHQEADETFRIEAIWWHRPLFRVDTPEQKAAENQNRKKWSARFIDRGEIDFPSVIDEMWLAQFEQKYARYHLMALAYQAAWLARTAREPNAGHAPTAAITYIDKDLWTETDWTINTRSLVLAAERRHITTHKRIERDYAQTIRDLDFTHPIVTPDGIPLVRRVNYDENHEVVVEATRADAPPRLGPNGRPTVRTLAFTDELLPYYAYVEEGPPEDREWSIDWPENPNRPSPREAMRAELEGTPNEYLLEWYSDERIIYTLPDEEIT